MGSGDGVVDFGAGPNGAAGPVLLPAASLRQPDVLESTSSTKGHGKGRPSPRAPPPPGKGKAKGGAGGAHSGLPSFEVPRLPSDWQADRVVNWQPIRQASRFNGSVWEQVHGSLQSSLGPPPESLLRRFMRKRSEVPAAVERRKASPARGASNKSRRLLPRQVALIADVNHALLVRKGIKNPNQLRWVVGKGVGDDGGGDREKEEAPLSDEVLEALLGLLGTAVNDEVQLLEANADSGLCRAEDFLRRLSQEGGVSLVVLRTRVEMLLSIARVPARIDDVHDSLEMVLGAAASVMYSKALPVLLEGILLLGNYVNANSRQLGGAIGVTLQSLTKLAHTQCLPQDNQAQKKRDQRNQKDNALVVLVKHLEETRPSFADTLAHDLNPCLAVRDFDARSISDSVQELTLEIQNVSQHHVALKQAALADPAALDSQPPALAPAKLQKFLAEAVPKCTQTQALVAELQQTTTAMRRWFAEPPESSLADMLGNLATLREALPAARPSSCAAAAMAAAARRPLQPPPLRPCREPRDPTPPPPPLADQESEASLRQVQRQHASPAGAVNASAKEGPRSTTIPRLARTRSLPGFEGDSPRAVVVQILSFSSGLLSISWLFDWTGVPSTFKTEASMNFEVMQFKDNDAEQKRWICSRPPLKVEVAADCCHLFQVRAVLSGSGSANEEILWASPPSAPITADLRCSVTPGKMRSGADTDPAAISRHASAGDGRRSAVASSIDSFLRGRSTSMASNQADGTSPGSDAGLLDIQRSKTVSAASAYPALDGSPSTTVPRTLLPIAAVTKGLLAEEHQQDLVLKSLLEATVEVASDGSSSGTSRIGSISDFDDESLRYLAQSLSFLERNVNRCAAGGEPGDVATVKEQAEDEDTPLPRRDDYFDDDALMRMAQAISSLETVTNAPLNMAEAQSPATPSLKRFPEQDAFAEAAAWPSASREEGNAGWSAPEPAPEPATISRAFHPPRSPSPSAKTPTKKDEERILDGNEAFQPPRSPSQSAKTPTKKEEEQILDGNEVLAATERAFRNRTVCKVCHGTTQMGLFGKTGLGFFKVPCQACEGSGLAGVKAADCMVSTPHSPSGLPLPLGDGSPTPLPEWQLYSSRSKKAKNVAHAFFEHLGYGEQRPGVPSKPSEQVSPPARSVSTSSMGLPQQRPAPFLAAPLWAAPAPVRTSQPTPPAQADTAMPAWNIPPEDDSRSTCRPSVAAFSLASVKEVSMPSVPAEAPSPRLRYSSPSAGGHHVNSKFDVDVGCGIADGVGVGLAGRVSLGTRDGCGRDLSSASINDASGLHGHYHGGDANASIRGGLCGGAGNSTKSSNTPSFQALPDCPRTTLVDEAGSPTMVSAGPAPTGTVARLGIALDFRLEVQLATEARTIEFRRESDLSKLIQDFVVSNRLLRRFEVPLVQRAKQMLQDGLSSDTVDVVDLI